MDNITAILLFIALLFVITVIIILVLILNNNKKTNDLYNELSKSVYDIKNNISKDFLNFNQNINGELNSFSDRVNSNLIQSRSAANDIFNNINERMIKIDEAQKGLNELSNEVVSLQTILTDKKSRGTFGEVELYSLLESAYGINNELFQKQYHLPNGSIADAVIFGGDSLGILCIDSKFPLENYRRIYADGIDDNTRNLYRKQFKEDVKKHINDIKNKYIIPGVTSDMAYMFIPAEAIFAEIYSNCIDLVDYSYNCKVYLVSPTTLMAYITAIKSIYLGQKKDEKAKVIASLLAELSIEFERFKDRTNSLIKDYEKLGNDFIQLETTSNKISKKFSKINNGDIDESQEQ